MIVCEIAGCERPRKSHGLCNTHNERRRRHGSPTVLPPRRVTNPVDRFWRRVDRSGDCWTMPTNSYGNVRLGRKGSRTMPAHRFAWTITQGCVPFGLEVCHQCDNPPCVNPAHLFLGTTLDNKRDSIAKGRHAHGETAGAARLSSDDVQHIRAAYASGFVTEQDLGDFYGLTQAGISAIVRRVTWR